MESSLPCELSCRYHLPETDTQPAVCRLIRQLDFKDPPSSHLKAATRDQITDLLTAWKTGIPDLCPFFRPVPYGI